MEEDTHHNNNNNTSTHNNISSPATLTTTEAASNSDIENDTEDDLNGLSVIHATEQGPAVKEVLSSSSSMELSPENPADRRKTFQSIYSKEKNDLECSEKDVVVEQYRTITLKLVEEQPKRRMRSMSEIGAFSNLTKSFRQVSHSLKDFEDPVMELREIGVVNVSWFDGTSSEELYAHVEASISHRLGDKEIDSFRLILQDIRGSDLGREVVLSPHIPSGSTFLVKVVIAKSPRIIYRSMTPAPDSPSAAPNTSPKLVVDGPKRALNGLNGFSLDGNNNGANKKVVLPNNSDDILDASSSKQKLPKLSNSSPNITSLKALKSLSHDTPKISGKMDGERVVIVTQTPQQEKQHVIFTIANYFVLFLSIIAVSAELAERAPIWIENHIAHVNQCAVDQDSLFECINRGEITGVVAAFGLWMAKSESTKRFLLFGFSNVDKLWAVVYESFVSAFCWGFSYLFIRRGLNPDSRENLMKRFWKDAVYGSLAGFNASFMKAVLKNLIPKEAIEEAVLESKQLRLVDWLIKR